jgi:hypothetical protein
LIPAKVNNIVDLYQQDGYNFYDNITHQRIDIFKGTEYICGIYSYSHKYTELKGEELEEYLISRCKHWLRVEAKVA